MSKTKRFQIFRRPSEVDATRRMSSCGEDIDKGYAWLIVVASAMGHFFTYGISWTSGIFYDILREEFAGSSGAISLIAALNTAFLYGGGPLSGALTNRFGHRVVAMAGGVIAGLGLVLSVFATRIYHLYITFGVITGFGLSIANIPLVTVVPLYFVKYRSIALGFAVAGTGIGTFCYPPVLRILLKEYGWRGAMLITGGVTLNICVCGAFMRQPRALVERHRRESTKTAENAVRNGDLDGNTPKDAKSVRKLKRQESLKKINVFLNLHVFKSTEYLVLCLNNILFIFALSIIYVHLPAFSETRDVSKDAAAMLISAIGISNVIGRVLFGLLAQLPLLTPMRLYVITSVSTGIVMLCFPVADSYTSLLAVSVLFGFLSAFIGPILPQVIGDILTLELVPSGYGYILIFEAVGNLLGPPTAGWLYDYLGAYEASFYLSGVAMVLSGIVMIFPLVTYKHTRELVLDDDDVKVQQCVDPVEEKLMLERTEGTDTAV